MVRFQKYQDMVSRGSSDRRRIVTNTLKGCRRENALSRLEAVKAALSNLKVQLSNGQSLDPKAEGPPCHCAAGKRRRTQTV